MKKIKRLVFGFFSLLVMSVMIIGCPPESPEPPPVAKTPFISVTGMNWEVSSIDMDSVSEIRFDFTYIILDAPSSKLSFSVFEVGADTPLHKDIKVYIDKEGTVPSYFQVNLSTGFEKGKRYEIQWEGSSGEYTFGEGESSPTFAILASATHPLVALTISPESSVNGGTLTIDPAGSAFSASDPTTTGTVDYTAVDDEGADVPILTRPGLTDFTSWTVDIPWDFITDPNGSKTVTITMTITNISSDTTFITRDIVISYAAEPIIPPDDATELVWHYVDDGTTAYPIDVTNNDSNLDAGAGGKLSVLEALKTVGENGTIIFKLTRKSNVAPSWLGMFSVGTLGSANTYDVYHQQGFASSTGRENRFGGGGASFGSNLMLNTPTYVAWQVKDGLTKCFAYDGVGSYASSFLFYDGTTFDRVSVGGMVRTTVLNPIIRADLVVDEIKVYNVPLDDLYLTDLIDVQPSPYLVAYDLFGPALNELDGRGNYRIPAIVTSSVNGTVIASIDARNGGTDSPNNLDTAYKVSRDNGRTFSEAKYVPAFYFRDFIDNSGTMSASASFIDPCLVEAQNGRILMLINTWNANGGIFGNCNTGTGFTSRSVNGVATDVLALGYFPNAVAETDNGTIAEADFNSIQGGGNYNASTGLWATADTLNIKYNYYVLDADKWAYEVNGVNANEADFKRRIYDNSDSTTEYYLDAFFNVWTDAGGIDTQLKVKQRITATVHNDVLVPMNIHYRDSYFQTRGTAYLWVIYTDDFGTTWSAPKNINAMLGKPSDSTYLIVSPGNAMTVREGTNTGRTIVGYYVNRAGANIPREVATTIYSDDNGETWDHTPFPSSTPRRYSEMYTLEMPNGGGARLMGRTDNNVGTLYSSDYGVSWTTGNEQISWAVSTWCQQSGVRLWQDGYGETNPHFVMSYPNATSRSNGTVSLVKINNNGSAVSDLVEVSSRIITGGGYAYSCITELGDGNIAVFYEPNGSTNMPYRVFSMEWLLNGTPGRQ